MKFSNYLKADFEYTKLNLFLFLTKNILLFIASLFVADILTPDIWNSNMGLFHTILELLCVFVSLSIFIIIWYTFDTNSSDIRLIGFAFLSVAIFNCLHVFYFTPLGYAPGGYDDLFARFGVISRLVEAVLLLVGVHGFIRFKINKWLLLILTLAGTFLISLTILWFPNLYPKLLTDKGTTIYRTIFEYIILLVFVFCIPALVKNVNKQGVLTYVYVLSAIIIGLPVQIFFSMYDDISSFYNTLGHILKIISYCLLFKGIFISAVTYPYRTKLEQLNVSEERFKNAFEYAAIGMAIIGLDGKWLKVNDSLCSITGYPQEELYKTTVNDITHPDDLESSRNLTEQLIQGEIPYCHMEKRYIHKSGRLLWIIISYSLVRDIKGNPIYFVAQLQDITELKNAYDTIEYDRLRNEFFANISHEFRTPLNIILNSIQLFNVYMKNYQDNDNKVAKLLSSMRKNCIRLIRLINNLIDTTRLDAGFFSLHKKNCNIVYIIEEITRSVAEFIKSKELQFEFDCDIEEKIIECDPDKIERIMLNLLSNAVKFTKENGKIMVNVHTTEDSIVISVKDNGIGIQKEKQDLIFQRFRQVDKSLTRSHEGSGLGLSIVKSLVELHGGTLKVESEYGKGSEFIIVLPAKATCNELSKIAGDEVAASYDIPLKNRFETINVEFSDIDLTFK